MLNAKDISFFEYIDRLLFGPTVAFEKSSAYGLAETVERLKAARLTLLRRLFPFSIGLTGSVNAKRISLAWQNTWSGHGIQPVFRGTTRSNGSTVKVVGTIGVPWYIKVLMLLWWIFWFTVLGITYWSDGFRGQPRGTLVFFIAFPIGIFTLLIVLSRIFIAGDYTLIADSIDTALS